MILYKRNIHFLDKVSLFFFYLSCGVSSALYVSILVSALERSPIAYLCFLVINVCSAERVCSDGAVFAPRVSCAVSQSNCVTLWYVGSFPEVSFIIGRLLAGVGGEYMYQSIGVMDTIVGWCGGLVELAILFHCITKLRSIKTPYKIE